MSYKDSLCSVPKTYDQLTSISTIFPNLEDSEEAGMIWWQNDNGFIRGHKTSLSYLNQILKTSSSIFSVFEPSTDITPVLKDDKISFVLNSTGSAAAINNLIAQTNDMTTTVEANKINFFPNWNIPNSYTDQKIQDLNNLLNPYLQKVDNYVFPWTDSDSFTVQKVVISGTTFYQGMVKGDSISPDAFVALVDKNTSNVTVVKNSPTTVTLTAPTAPKPTAQDINNVVLQDNNMTTSISGNFVAFLPNWKIPNDYTDTEIAKLDQALNTAVNQLTSQISYLQSEIDQLASGEGIYKQIRYDGLVMDDDKKIYHGGLASGVYNGFAWGYNWSTKDSSSYTNLPAPTPNVEKAYEAITIPANKAGHITNIGRTYYYLQIGQPQGGLSPEPQGTIIQADQATFTDYATVRFIARQNKLYGTYDCLDTNVPNLYREVGGPGGPNRYLTQIGATVKINTGSNSHILFSLKQPIDREISTTNDYDCMYSEQIPMTVLKIKNDGWYLAYEDEENLTNLLALYDTKDFTAYNKISMFDSKVVFFSLFGSFKAFVDAILTGKIAVDADSNFRVRFNIADCDNATGLPLPTCFDYELKDWNFTDGLQASERYLGSVFVSPKNTMIIEVKCSYNNTTKKLAWGGGNYVLDDAEFTLKDLARDRDRWGGGWAYDDNAASFNFVTNTHSSLITRFNLANTNMDGYDNKYIVDIFKVAVEPNEFDVMYSIGDIDVNRYYNTPDNVAGVGRLAQLEDGVMNWIRGSVSPDIQNVMFDVHFGTTVDYSKTPKLLSGWGAWSFNVEAASGGTLANNTVDKIRVSFLDETSNLKGNTLKFQIVSGSSVPGNIAVLAQISLDMTGFYPPYKVVFEWDSSNQQNIKIIEFTYNRKFT